MARIQMRETTFQPFLRFWLVRSYTSASAKTPFQPFLRFWMGITLEYDSSRNYYIVSTLLEILGLVCLVVVGF